MQILTQGTSYRTTPLRNIRIYLAEHFTKYEIVVEI